MHAYTDLYDIVYQTDSWMFRRAEKFGEYLGKTIHMEVWGFWKALEDEYTYMIRGKVRNTRQNICNPMIELSVNNYLPRLSKGDTLIMEYTTFLKMNQAIIRHEFREENENQMVVNLHPDSAFAVQHDGIDWFNRNPGDEGLSVLNFPRELIERCRECIVKIPTYEPYSKLCYWERDELFPLLADKAIGHKWYTEADPPPPIGQSDSHHV